MYRLCQDIAQSRVTKTTLLADHVKGTGLLKNGTFGFLVENGVTGNDRALITDGKLVEAHATPRNWLENEKVFDDNAISNGATNIITGGTREVGYVAEAKDTTGAVAGTDEAIITIVFHGGNS